MITLQIGSFLVYQGNFYNPVFFNPGQYTVEVRAWADNNHDTGYASKLEVTIVNPCDEILRPPSPMKPQIYYLNSGSSDYSVQEVDIENKFRPKRKLCGDVVFTARLFQIKMDKEGKLLSQNPNDLKAISDFSEVGLKFDSSGSFTIDESDANLIGARGLFLTAQLVDYPDVTTDVETVLPLYFITCPITVEPWKIGSVIVPTGISVEQVFEEPIFAYDLEQNCDYSWERFKVTSIVNTEQETEVPNSEDYMTLSEAERMLTYKEQIIYTQLVFNVTLTAYLSDKSTRVSTTALVTFMPTVSSQFRVVNTAPQFLIKPQSEYYR